MNKLLALFVVVVSLAAALHSQTGNHTVTLNWNASVDAVGNSPLSYNAYRAPGSCSSPTLIWQKIGSTSATSFADSEVAPGLYCYTVRSSLNGVESVNSNLVTATIVVAPPTNVTASPK